MIKTYEEVKADLKQLHISNYKITSYLKAKQNREQMIADLKATGKATVNIELMEILDSNVKKIKMDDIIEWARLENQYMDAINSLDDFGKRIITAYFLNARTYEQVAEAEMYTRQHIARLIDKEVLNIMEIINKGDI